MTSKNNYLIAAIKSLRKQVVKYQNERDQFESSENMARTQKEFFAKEVERIEDQISKLENNATL